MRYQFVISVFIALGFGCGCSLHPIQEDVTGVDTRDIVEEVRCEARASVLENFLADDVRDFIRTSEYQRTPLHELSSKEFDVFLDKLGRNHRAVYYASQRVCRKVLTGGEGSTKREYNISDIRACNTVNVRRKRDERKIPKDIEWDKKNTTEVINNSLKSYHFLEDPAWVASTNYKYMSLLSNDHYFTAIGFDFRFAISEKNAGSGAANFSLPFTNGSFGLALSAGKDKQRQGERSFKVVEYLAELLADDTLAGKCADQKNWTYPISGHVGLAGILATYKSVADLELTRSLGERGGGTSGAGGSSGGRQRGEQSNQSGSNVADYTDTLTFTTTINGSVNPSIRLDPVPNQFRLANASLSLGSERKDEHKLTVALSSTFSDTKLPASIAYGVTASRLPPTLDFLTIDPKQRVLLNLDREVDRGILRDLNLKN